MEKPLSTSLQIGESRVPRKMKSLPEPLEEDLGVHSLPASDFLGYLFIQGDQMKKDITLGQTLFVSRGCLLV